MIHHGIGSPLCIGVLGLAMCLSIPAPAHTQAPPQASATGASSRADDAAIRPFQVQIPDSAIADLRRRIAATRWPDVETVGDQTQGVQLARIRPLVEYWGTDYDWRRAEARLNALPQFMTTIDGLDIHFIHVRSRHPNAMPMIMTHGWPGSILELLKVIGPLTDPTAHGGRPEDAFDLVIPSMPGYGFSERPTEPGANRVDRMGAAWDVLMKRLGYTQYVSQGGDWGALVAEAMAVQAPEGLLGIHINMPGTVPPEVLRLVRNGAPVPAEFTDEEKRAYARLQYFYGKGFGYADIMNTRPQTISYGLTDSPAGMLAFFYDKFAEWTHTGGNPEQVLSRDDMLDNVTLYWFTNTGGSSSRSYWDAAQGGGGPFNAWDIPTVPVAVTVFPGEIYPAPRSWAEKSFKNLIYYNVVDAGGHFAAWEQPELFAREMRAAFAPLRASLRPQSASAGTESR